MGLQCCSAVVIFVVFGSESHYGRCIKTNLYITILCFPLVGTIIGEVSGGNNVANSNRGICISLIPRVIAAQLLRKKQNEQASETLGLKIKPITIPPRLKMVTCMAKASSFTNRAPSFQILYLYVLYFYLIRHHTFSATHSLCATNM